MNAALPKQFREVWLVDFEFHQPNGEAPEVLCMVALELRSGRIIRVWADRLGESPIASREDVLLVAFYASAELGCFLALGWTIPKRILDLYAEFRWLTNGLTLLCGTGLLGALAYFGLDAIGGLEKEAMRDLAIRGGPYTVREQEDLLDYCESDVLALEKLLKKMGTVIDWPRALLRGRSMAAAARIEQNGVPIDGEMLSDILGNWEEIKRHLIRRVDRDIGVYVPTGQRPINPKSRLGAAILETASEQGADPHQLAEAVQDVWKMDREQRRDFIEAVQAARQATGLTRKRIEQWENSGRDHSTYPHLDTQARELAAEYPELGIGRGYVADEGYDDTDHAGLLWDVLRNADDQHKPKHHPEILDRAVEIIAGLDGDDSYGPLSFSTARFASWLTTNGIPWPRLDSGALELSDEAFRQMARRYPQVAPIRELRHTLSQMRLNDLAVGSDGRNRCMLSAFRARTGRYQPSNSKFIFGPSAWLRALIKPPPDHAVAYIDWCQQEFGIAAGLSGDKAMQEAYLSGEPYLTFAKQAGAVPTDATKESHAAERAQFKVCALAVQYGMGAKSLAHQLGLPEARARQLLQLHRQTYPVFWRWSDAAVNVAMLRNRIHTVFGWPIHVGTNVNARGLANFPMQANGAEMLRLACCLTTENGVRVCAPVHDALLVESELDEIDEVVAATQHWMAEASRIVLSGFTLRSDVNIVSYPERYMDERGERLWQVVTEILEDIVDPVSF